MNNKYLDSKGGFKLVKGSRGMEMEKVLKTGKEAKDAV